MSFEKAQSFCLPGRNAGKVGLREGSTLTTALYYKLSYDIISAKESSKGEGEGGKLHDLGGILD